MEHAEVLEALELAAVEPDGVERLEAGDPPEAAGVASHLASCATCRAEWVRLRRTSVVLRAAIAGSAPADLRERTLRYVRELGRPRGAAIGTPELDGSAATVVEAALLGAPGAGRTPLRALPNGSASAAGAAAEAGTAAAAGSAGAAADAGIRAAAELPARDGRARPAEPSSRGSEPASLEEHRARRNVVVRRLVALAAVVVLAVALAGIWAFEEGRVGQASSAYRDRLDSLGTLLVAQGDLASRTDVRRVRLVDSTGAARGSVTFSPADGELIMVATGLQEPAAGQVMNCWLETAGGRKVLGQVQFEDSVAYWWGWPKGLAPVPAGARFGVSPGSPGSAGTSAPVLTGVVGA